MITIRRGTIVAEFHPRAADEFSIRQSDEAENTVSVVDAHASELTVSRADAVQSARCDRRQQSAVDALNKEGPRRDALQQSAVEGRRVAPVRNNIMRSEAIT